MAQQHKQPFRRSKTFKALVLCLYVYSCVQLDPFDNMINIHLDNNLQAEESQLELVIKDKLTKLILAFFQE